MSVRFLDVTLDNLGLAPAECLETVFWELGEERAPEDARFHKEEWFSWTLLEWGTCGKLSAADSGEASDGFVQFAPGPFFPRLAEYRCGRVSDDAVYLSYCYVVEPRRGSGLGSRLIRAVAGDLLDRGYRAIEAIGDRDWREGWVLPAPFLAANGFRVLRDDPRLPLMRLELRATVGAAAARDAAAVPVPELPGPELPGPELPGREEGRGL
jgi:GNAT superfamily N-acetyltransferase